MNNQKETYGRVSWQCSGNQGQGDWLPLPLAKKVAVALIDELSVVPQAQVWLTEASIITPGDGDGTVQ